MSEQKASPGHTVLFHPRVANASAARGGSGEATAFGHVLRSREDHLVWQAA